MTSCNLANTPLCGVDIKHNSRLYSRFTDYLKLEGASGDYWINPHKAAHGRVLSNPSMECQQPLGKLLEGSITLTVGKTKGFIIFLAFQFVPIMRMMERKSLLKKWGQFIQKLHRQKTGPSQILEFLFTTIYCSFSFLCTWNHTTYMMIYIERLNYMVQKIVILVAKDPSWFHIYIFTKS